jgi:transposase
VRTDCRQVFTNQELDQRTSTKIHHLCQLMAKGKAVPKSIRWIVVRLSTTMTEDEISMYTDIGVRTVQKILVHFKQTGNVGELQKMRPQLHRSLCDFDIQVRHNCFVYSQIMTDAHWQYLHTTLNKTPDLYLDELRLELEQMCGVSVSMSTIWRTLVKSGYTMKKACR